MPIQHIHSFLVQPAKNLEEQPQISGTAIPQRGMLYEMLAGIFDRSLEECKIEIAFRANDAGQQQNDARDLLITYAQASNIPNGQPIARRLQSVSTHRSGLGLLFLIKGEVNGSHQLVISRFPADQGVIADATSRRLEVEFVERVFMKSAKAYKSVIYVSDSFQRGFWDGHAVDLQITGPKELSDYWIREFLASELRTTGPAGTKRLALALRTAVHDSAELAVKQELISFANLLRGQDGQRRSVNQIVDRFDLSVPARTALQEAFSRPDLMDEIFEFDNEEFRQHAAYRGVELDNGAVLLAEDSRFDQIFTQEEVNQDNQRGPRVRFSTEGQITTEYLRKQK